jgi:hypothetical protein
MAYDYYLGGKDNLAADRAAAEAALQVAPDMRVTARSNRAFLGRAVRFLAQAGIKQIIDISTGIPTAGNTHQIAQAVDPDIRVSTSTTTRWSSPMPGRSWPTAVMAAPRCCRRTCANRRRSSPTPS